MSWKHKRFRGRRGGRPGRMSQQQAEGSILEEGLEDYAEQQAWEAAIASLIDEYMNREQAEDFLLSTKTWYVDNADGSKELVWPRWDLEFGEL